jgi:predicted hotdog family 3-hydroxylacyl-ACP dehydratase
MKPAAAGLLASARSVSLHVSRLDDIAEPLDIRVEQLGGGAGGLLYAFQVSAAGRALVEGRLTIALEIPSPEAAA